MKSRKSVAYLLLFILLGGLAHSCQNRPKEVLNRKQMERLMYDVYIAEATIENDYQNFNTLEQKEAYINRVFKAHKTTQAHWDTSLSWYSDRIDLYLKMNDSVKARLQRTRQEIEVRMAQQNQREIDFTLLPPSYLPPYYHFSMPDTKRGVRFLLDSTEISAKVTGDDFLFSFSVLGIPPRFSLPFTSLLTMVYADTTLYQFQRIEKNRTYELSGSKYIPGDTIIQISAFVHLQDSSGVIPPIQLYNIFFGDKQSAHSETGSLVIETDSLMNETDSLNGEALQLDSLNQSVLEPSDILQPDSIQEM